MPDVGQSGNFADNAYVLRIYRSRIETLAILHHHHEHTGGLGGFFMENASSRVYSRQTGNVEF